MTARLEGITLEITCRRCGRHVIRDLGSIAKTANGEPLTLRQTLTQLRRRARCSDCRGRSVALAIRYEAKRGAPTKTAQARPLIHVAGGRWQDRRPWSRFLR